MRFVRHFLLIISTLLVMLVGSASIAVTSTAMAQVAMPPVIEQDGVDCPTSHRNAQTVVGRFTTEEEACHYLYARLTERPSPAPDAAEQIEEVLAQRAEIQRRAWEAFNRAPSRPPSE